MENIKLSPFERLQLANQFSILEKVYPEEATYYAGQREIVSKGYTIKYGEVFSNIWPEMPFEECSYVYEVLDMYRVLIRSFEELKDKQGLAPDDVKFQGFDANNEGQRWGFVEYLKRNNLWTETLSNTYLNSHSMRTMTLYPAMLKRWEANQATDY